ncbi:MAG: restriction endonuclease subunit S [Ignavibacteriaceae bacterium]
MNQKNHSSDNEWKEYKFSDLLVDESISYGIVQPGSHTEVNSVPIIRVNNIKNGHIQTDNVMKVSSDIEDKYKKTRLVGGELLVTVVGSIGECAIVPRNLRGWNVARAVSVARIKKIFDKHFIKCSFLSDDFKFLVYGNTNDTVQPTLNLSSIKEIKFRLPSLPEQRAIASILSSLDDKIDLLHRQNKTLEQLAETLFRQWFVDEAEEGWEIGKLGDVIELIYGKGLKEEIRTDKGFPVVGSSGIVGYHSEYLVEGPGIVIGRKGTLGKVVYLFENFFPIDTTYFVKSKINSIGLFYEYFLLKTLNFGDLNSDSAVPGLNRDIALSTEIRNAPPDKISEFNQQSFSLFEKLNQNNNQIHTLTKLRDTLLPKLMSGEVRVK